MSKLRIITLLSYVQYKDKRYKKRLKGQGQAVCNIQSIKMVQDIFSPYICHIKIMIHIRKFTVMNILG